MTITLGARTELKATVASSAFEAGEIELEAEAATQREATGFLPVGVSINTATITVGSATIEGGGVSITATAEDKGAAEDTGKQQADGFGEYTQGWTEGVESLLDQVPDLILSGLTGVSGQVSYRSATATVSVTGAAITAEGSLEVGADAASNASLNTVSYNGFEPTGSKYAVSIGLGWATATALVTIDKSTLTGEDVSVTSSASNEAFVKARTAGNANPGEKTTQANAFSFAVAVVNTNETSHVTIKDPTTKITASDGPVDISATGEVLNFAWAQPTISAERDGRVRPGDQRRRRRPQDRRRRHDRRQGRDLDNERRADLRRPQHQLGRRGGLHGEHDLPPGSRLHRRHARHLHARIGRPLAGVRASDQLQRLLRLGPSRDGHGRGSDPLLRPGRRREHDPACPRADPQARVHRDDGSGHATLGKLGSVDFMSSDVTTNTDTIRLHGTSFVVGDTVDYLGVVHRPGDERDQPRHDRRRALDRRLVLDRDRRQRDQRRRRLPGRHSRGPRGQPRRSHERGNREARLRLRDRRASFDPKTAVSSLSNTITFTSPHSFQTGDAVVYRTDPGNSSTHPLPPAVFTVDVDATRPRR